MTLRPDTQRAVRTISDLNLAPLPALDKLHRGCRSVGLDAGFAVLFGFFVLAAGAESGSCRSDDHRLDCPDYE